MKLIVAIIGTLAGLSLIGIAILATAKLVNGPVLPGWVYPVMVICGVVFIACAVIGEIINR